MASYQGEQLNVRVPEKLRTRLKEAAAAEGVKESEYIREVLEEALNRTQSAHAADPLVDALHRVLPRYFQSIRDLVAGARYDAVIARELAKAAGHAALLANGYEEAQVREIMNQTVGAAVKVANRRMHDFEFLKEVVSDAADRTTDR